MNQCPGCNPRNRGVFCKEHATARSLRSRRARAARFGVNGWTAPPKSIGLAAKCAAVAKKVRKAVRA